MQDEIADLTRRLSKLESEHEVLLKLQMRYLEEVYRLQKSLMTPPEIAAESNDRRKAEQIEAHHRHVCRRLESGAFGHTRHRDQT